MVQSRCARGGGVSEKKSRVGASKGKKPLSYPNANGYRSARAANKEAGFARCIYDYLTLTITNVSVAQQLCRKLSLLARTASCQGLPAPPYYAGCGLAMNDVSAHLFFSCGESLVFTHCYSQAEPRGAATLANRRRRRVASELEVRAGQARDSTSVPYLVCKASYTPRPLPLCQSRWLAPRAE